MAFIFLAMSDLRKHPIGIFDSGYGGLTVLKEIKKQLPQYDYIYLGDNARTPYGTRSFETVYQFTLEAVRKMFDIGCYLIILACNTASAKALRTIQQNDLPRIDPQKRVLGVIRPSTETVGTFTNTGNIGILGTRGTVTSESYPIEINKFFPDVNIYQQACPMWVPLVENNEHLEDGADFYVKKYLDKLFVQNNTIDTIVLGCTHYPLLEAKIESYLRGTQVKVISQGSIVASSLNDYLNRHPEIEEKCSLEGEVRFFTTDSPSLFNANASIFYGEEVEANYIDL